MLVIKTGQHHPQRYRRISFWRGFVEAEKVHGVHYTHFIGDGDSSVHSVLLRCVPGWGACHSED